ncbi:hypothetical protein BOX15_Mlig015610g1, partial [Macrostomum lignano]
VTMGCFLSRPVTGEKPPLLDYYQQQQQQLLQYHQQQQQQQQMQYEQQHYKYQQFQQHQQQQHHQATAWQVGAATPVTRIRCRLPQPHSVEQLPPPPPPARRQSQLVARALFAYKAQHQDDLAFCVGDKLEILSGGTRQPWWFARHSATGLTGYVPGNHLQLESDDRASSLAAWFEVSRRDADRHLLLPGNPSGTYILRPSSQGQYALSVRVKDPNLDRNFLVRHFRIRCTDAGGYYIAPRVTFPTLRDLLAHYSEVEDIGGIGCRLTAPCPRAYKPPVQFRDVEVNRACVRLGGRLGGGSFGEVYLARWNDCLDVAVKTMKPNATDAERFISEARILHRLNHPRVVQLLGVCTDGEPLYIITELMPEGALLDFLRREAGSSLCFDQLIDMMAQVADGMAYLETMNFVHRDLRAANILVGQNRWLKVADFGLARIMDAAGSATAGAKFPIRWTAPEAAGWQRAFSVKSDVWSFGVLMWEIVTYGRVPYPGMANRQVLQAVAGGYRMPNPHDGSRIRCDPGVYLIMSDCWAECPASRPTFFYLKDALENYSVTAEAQYVQDKL